MRYLQQTTAPCLYWMCRIRSVSLITDKLYKCSKLCQLSCDRRGAQIRVVTQRSVDERLSVTHYTDGAKTSRHVVLFHVSALSEEPKKSVVRLANLKARTCRLLSTTGTERTWTSDPQCVAGTNRPVPGVSTACVLQAQTGLFLALVLPVCCRHKQACCLR
jgi:hypothetical protein